MESYVSAGLYCDSQGRDCIAVQARFAGSAEAQALLLYSHGLVERSADATSPGQWSCTSEGRGNFLHQVQRDGGVVVAAIDKVRLNQQVATVCHVLCLAKWAADVVRALCLKYCRLLHH